MLEWTLLAVVKKWGWLEWWWNLRVGLVMWGPLHIRIGVGESDDIGTDPAVVAIGCPMASLWRRAMGHNFFFVFRLLFFGLVCWLALISRYSIEIGFVGFGHVVEPFLLHYSRKLCALTSVLSCYLHNSELPLHGVCLFWNTVSKRVK